MRNYYKYLLKFKKPDSPFPYVPPYFNSFNNIIPNKNPFFEDDIRSDDYLQQIDKPQSFGFNNHHYNFLSPKNTTIHPYSYNKIIPREHHMFNHFVRNKNFHDSIESEYDNYNMREMFYNRNEFEKAKLNEEDSFDNKGFVVVYQDDESISREGVGQKKMDMSFEDRSNKDGSLQDFVQENNTKFNNYNIFQTCPNNYNYAPTFNSYNPIGNLNEQQFQQPISNHDNNIFGIYNNSFDRHNLINNLTNNYQHTNKKFSPITPISHSSLSLRQFSPFIRRKRRKNYIDSNLSFLNSLRTSLTNSNKEYFLFKPASINIFEIYSNKQESISSSPNNKQTATPVTDDNQINNKLHQVNNTSIAESTLSTNNNVSSINKCGVTNITNNYTSSTTNTYGNDTNQLDMVSNEEKRVSKPSKNRIKKPRKYKPDDIRKKIKARFHKILKNRTNQLLEKAGSKIMFDFLPQSFICNISRGKNREMMQLTYRELLKKDFSKEVNPEKYKKTQVDKTKYYNNQEVLRYLERHGDIKKKSGFDIIENLFYIQILKEYFKSEDFVGTVRKLEGKEDESYIKEYVYNAKNYIDFFLEPNL